MAATLMMALPTQKPRIGFSIESIVGSQKPESSERPASPLGDSAHFPGYPAGCREQPLPHQRAYLLQRQQQQEQQARELLALRERISQGSGDEFRLQDSPSSEGTPNRSASLRMIDLSSNSSRSSPPPHTRLSPECEPHPRAGHPTSPRSSPGPPPPTSSKGPIMVPGIPAGLVRPFPMVPNGELKPLPSFMPGGTAAELAVQAAHKQQLLAAQFQAALAHAHGQGAFGGHPATHLHPNHPANMPRESYPLYPWLLSRHGRNVFPPRFPGN
uniref:Homeobox domain-containing protein n=1 Tax=Anopheles epiroticus TaxID=199890 RepID=A0A182PGN7_9DIPT